jgi:hypothetical protein
MLKFGTAIGFRVKVADLFEFQGGFLRDGEGGSSAQGNQAFY